MVNRDSVHKPLEEWDHRWRNIKRLIRGLDHLFAQAEKEPELAAMRQQTEESLTELKRALITYFTEEEALDKSSDQASACAALERHHPEMLAQLEGLVKSVQVQPFDAAMWKNWRQEFRHIARAILKYEETERGIIASGPHPRATPDGQ